MKYLLICLLFIACQKENECGKVVKKVAYMNIHGTYLDVRYGSYILRHKVDLPTYTQYQIGDNYCQN